MATLNTARERKTDPPDGDAAPVSVVTPIRPLSAPGADDLAEFGTESGQEELATSGTGNGAASPAPAPRQSWNPGLNWRWLAAAAVLVAAAAAGTWGYQLWAAPAAGSLTLHTTPAGVQVTIAGRPAGLTPLTVSLPAGDHPVVLSGADGQQRELTVAVTAGGSMIQHLEMPAAAPAAAPTVGALHVQTDPPGQVVLVDGVERGVSPITVPALEAGDHQVLVRDRTTTTRRTVTVKAGETLSLVLAGASAPAVTAGWLTLSSPVTLQLRENGELIGTTDTPRLVMTAGDHQIELANEALGFRTTRRVTIASGKTASVRVEMPNGRLNINAVPWADVWIDGERIGQTPIANLARPIGSHEVIFRHPQFGERRTSVTVTVSGTARLGVDMRQP